jgi:hypothetical protein
MKYTEYFDTMFTVKVNKDLKEKIAKEIKKNNLKWQDLLDDFLRQKADEYNIKFNKPRIRRKEVIE